MPDGYSGEDIFKRMNANGSTTQTLDAAQQSADALQRSHYDLSARIGKIQGIMDTAWKGDASAKAQAGLNPLIQTSEQAASDLERSKGSMHEQNMTFHDTRGKLQKVEGARPDDQGFTDYMSFGASDDEVKAAAWDSANKNNIEHYNYYNGATDTNLGNAAHQYPVLNNSTTGVAVEAPPGAGSQSSPGPGGGGGGRHSGGGTRASGYTGGPSTYTAPPGAGSYQAPPSPPPNNPPPAPQVPQWRPPNQNTGASGYVPPKPPAGSGYPGSGFNSGSGGGFGPTGGAYDPSGGFGPTGGGGFGPVGSGGSSGGSGAGFGSGKSSGALAGGGTGSGGPLSGGRGSGVGMPGESGGMRGGPTAGGGAGTAGGKGAPGMGGMGGAKGQGAEDEEHQRKITLPDQDPDSIFGGIPDGQKPTPPVIGA